MTETIFEAFWKAYPKKKSKGSAERAWKKVKPDEALVQKILKVLEVAKRSWDWKKEKGRYIPYPATWLNAKGWEDEIMEESQTLPQPIVKKDFTPCNPNIVQKAIAEMKAKLYRQKPVNEPTKLKEKKQPVYHEPTPSELEQVQRKKTMDKAKLNEQS